MLSSGLLGDPNAVGEADDAQQPLSRRRRFYEAEPPGEVFNPFYEAFIEATKLYDGLVVTEFGFDQYDNATDQYNGERRGGWIACRYSSAPTYTERPVRLSIRKPGLSLQRLEQQELDNSERNKRLIEEKRVPSPEEFCDITKGGEDEMTNVEVQSLRADLAQMEGRLAEALNGIAWRLDRDHLREASEEDFLNENDQQDSVA